MGSICSYRMQHAQPKALCVLWQILRWLNYFRLQLKTGWLMLNNSIGNPAPLAIREASALLMTIISFVHLRNSLSPGQYVT